MTVISTLPICCICGQVSDEQAGASVEVEWTQLQTYLDRYHMDQASIRLSHTYCPSCYKKQAQVWRVLPTAPLST
jgi:hypothetical protein